MGKARIVSGGEDGLYWVELLHNRDRIDAELADLTQRLTDLQAELDALEAEREPLVAERNWIATDIDEAVAAAEEGEVPDVEALLVELAQVSAKIQSLDARIAMLKGRILVARKRQQMLQAVPENPTQEAWCADLTEDLAGEVATVEVPAEGVVGQFLTWRRMQIRPGFFDRAAYLKPRDGQMFHRQGMSPEQAYFNAAILPGVQRWRPQYRIGTLVSVDQGNDTCSLNLQSEDSSAQKLIIDPPVINTLTLGGVPIEYMNCNALPFEVGDRVLVEFSGRDWTQPRVIGFESEPRECPCYWPPGYAEMPDLDQLFVPGSDAGNIQIATKGEARYRRLRRTQGGDWSPWWELDALESAYYLDAQLDGTQVGSFFSSNSSVGDIAMPVPAGKRPSRLRVAVKVEVSGNIGTPLGGDQQRAAFTVLLLFSPVPSGAPGTFEWYAVRVTASTVGWQEFDVAVPSAAHTGGRVLRSITYGTFLSVNDSAEQGARIRTWAKCVNIDWEDVPE